MKPLSEARTQRILFALLLLMAFAQVAAQEQWQKFSPPDGDFSIEFPGKPTYEEVPVPATGEKLRVYHFAYGNNYLSLRYVDLRFPSAAVKASAAVRLEEYARDYAKTISDAGGQMLR